MYRVTQFFEWIAHQLYWVGQWFEPVPEKEMQAAYEQSVAHALGNSITVSGQPCLLGASHDDE
jgi:hypothetical protein